MLAGCPLNRSGLRLDGELVAVGAFTLDNSDLYVVGHLGFHLGLRVLFEPGELCDVVCDDLGQGVLFLAEWFQAAVVVLNGLQSLNLGANGWETTGL